MMHHKSESPQLCPYGDCSAELIPSNAATNFRNPVIAVKAAVDRGLIDSGQTVLEFGAGNLRNALFILRSMNNVDVFAYDLPKTVRRFPEKYEKFSKLGGIIVDSELEMRAYDVVVSAYVLETICPETARKTILKSINNSLKFRGLLIASFRGYPGVKGSQYKKCPMGEGLISPHKTFVKPYSLTEVQKLLTSCNFSGISFLKNYRVEKPQNIQAIALRE
jgi:hypothetical protein